MHGHDVTFDALGVAAVRLSEDGRLEAMAAGGLKHFKTGSVEITLDQAADIAVWRDAKGVMQGVLQDYEGEVPASLMAITPRWLRVAVPPPLPPENAGIEGAPIRKATASSQYDATHDAGKANDGIMADDEQNFWASANNQDVGSWWQADLGEITSIPQSGSSSGSPAKNITLSRKPSRSR